MADILDGLFISEILADNAGGQAIDTDGDGNENKADEYIEIQNNTNQTISLDGYELWSDANGELFAFGPTDTLGPGEVATVLGNYTGTPPPNFYSAGIPEGGNFLPDGEGNKFDTLYLVNRDTGEYVQLTYGRPPRPADPPPDFPGTTQIGGGETIDSTSPNGTAFARDANGVLIETTPTPGTPNIPCFVERTVIETSSGGLPIEALRPRDLIATLDNGLQPLRAIRRSRVNPLTLLLTPRARPVAFPAMPGHDPLLLSSSHRIMLRSASAHLLFDTAEVLVSAQNAGRRLGAKQSASLAPVVYYHLLFDNHEIIRANGYWCESLYAGAVAQATYADTVGWRSDPSHPLSAIKHTRTARRVLTGFETVVLLRDAADLELADATDIHAGQSAISSS